MKKFYQKIVYFVLPLMILAIPLDFGISHFLSQSNQYPGEFEVMNDIYNSNADCEVAIYGSSRAWQQIDPNIISDTLHLKTYNFGIDGHNFWLQYLRHLIYLKYNKKPKMIILSVDIFTLQKRVDLYQPDQFLPYMLWDKKIRKYTSSYIGYNKVDYYLPLVRYTGKSHALKTSIKMFIKDTPVIRFRNNGFFGMDMEWNTDFERARAEQKSYEIEFDKESMDLFEIFIQECKEMGIEVVLVYTPEYIEGQSFVSNRNEVIEIYNNYSEKYDLEFYDYSNDRICFDKTYFYNANHLNKKGTEIFSAIFANDLKARDQILALGGEVEK